MCICTYISGYVCITYDMERLLRGAQRGFSPSWTWKIGGDTMVLANPAAQLPIACPGLPCLPPRLCPAFGVVSGVWHPGWIHMVVLEQTSTHLHKCSHCETNNNTTVSKISRVPPLAALRHRTSYHSRLVCTEQSISLAFTHCSPTEFQLRAGRESSKQLERPRPTPT